MNMEKLPPASSYPPKSPSLLIKRQGSTVYGFTNGACDGLELSRIFNVVAAFGVFPTSDNTRPRLCRLSAPSPYRLSAALFKRSVSH